MKRIMKSILVTILAFAMILGSTPLQASAVNYLTVDKDFYLVSEKMTVVVNGLTQTQIEDQGAWVGIFLKGDKPNATAVRWSYISDLSDGKTWKVAAPYDFGDYEVRLYWTENDEDKIMESVPFKVSSLPSKPGDLSINKDRFLAYDKATVTIAGLTEGQIEDGAWAGIFLVSDKVMANAIQWVSINDLRDGKTWLVTVPNKYAKYEVRVYTKGNDNNEEAIRTEALFGKLPFIVASNPAKPGDLKISKERYSMDEDVTVTITGITPGQLEDGAWAGIYLPNDKYNATPIAWVSISDLRDGKTWKFKAPDKPGKYEVRVFTQNSEEIEDLELAFFGKLNLTVINATGSAAESKAFDWTKHKLSFSKNALTVSIGKTAKLGVLATPVAGGKAIPANQYVTYKSSNTKIATVDKNGVIKGIAKGVAKITVTAGKTSRVINVTVIK